MEILNSAPLIALVLLLLYPIELWDPPLPPRAARSGHRIPDQPAKSDLSLAPAPRMDRRAFLSTLERQAGAELVPCLRTSVAETGAISWIARLSKNGKLTGIRTLDSRVVTIPCATTALEKMSFNEAAASLSEENAEVVWRFEW